MLNIKQRCTRAHVRVCGQRLQDLTTKSSHTNFKSWNHDHGISMVQTENIPNCWQQQCSIRLTTASMPTTSTDCHKCWSQVVSHHSPSRFYHFTLNWFSKSHYPLWSSARRFGSSNNQREVPRGKSTLWTQASMTGNCPLSPMTNTVPN